MRPNPALSASSSSSSASSSTAQLRCIGCGAVASSTAPDFRCSACGHLLEVHYPEWRKQASFGPEIRDLWRKRRSSSGGLDQSGVWRFRELLPFLQDGNTVVTLREGNTPLFEMPRCARAADVAELLAKHQGMNPTGSFKDTGMTTAISKAREEGAQWVACASTGNTSASMAAYAARAGMNSLVLLPQGKISSGKLSQTLEYGALVCQLRTDFDGCLRILNEVVQRAPVYLVNSVNPYRLEGQKTVAVELLEQLDWYVPDHIIVPGGNLGNSSAIGKALLEMQSLGLIPRLPKLSVIQAEGANALVRTMREAKGERLIAVEAETHATAIRIGNPASWKKAVHVLQSTGGTCEQVSEEEIALAKAKIGAEGIGCEPASAVTLAGLFKLVSQGFVQRTESVVLVLTGHLLKDPDYTLAFHTGQLFPGAGAESPPAHDRKEGRGTPGHGGRNEPMVLDASLDAVLKVLEKYTASE